MFIQGVLGFNKKNVVRFDSFNGVSKEFLQGSNKLNDTQRKLVDDIFKKYDNGDGILSKQEFDAIRDDLERFSGDRNLGMRELAKFNKNLLGEDTKAAGKAYGMDDLYSVVNLMTNNTDDIINTEKLPNGNLKVTHKPDEDKRVKIVEYDPKGTPLSEDIRNYRQKGGSVIPTSIIEHTKYTRSGKITTKYDDREHPTSIIEKRGAYQTIEWDPESPDKILRRSIENPQTGEVRDYEYRDDGLTESITKYTGDKITTVYDEFAQMVDAYVTTKNGTIINFLDDHKESWKNRIKLPEDSPIRSMADADDVVAELLSERGIDVNNAFPEVIDKLKADLIRYNPSLFDKNGELKTWPAWSKLDFPSVENLQQNYGL